MNIFKLPFALLRLCFFYVLPTGLLIFGLYLAYQVPLVRRQAEPVVKPVAAAAAPVIDPVKEWLLPKEPFFDGVARRTKEVPTKFAGDLRRISRRLVERCLDMLISWQAVVAVAIAIYFRKNIWAFILARQQ